MFNLTETTIFYIGILITLLGLYSKIPQIIKIYKTKSGNDISYKMLISQNINYILCIILAIENNQKIFIISYIISFLQNIVIFGLTRYYKNIKID